MSNYVGDFAAGSTVTQPITTNAAAGGAVAPSSAFEAADVVIYKGSSATQRSSAAGITMTSPFDSVTGQHMLAIDTSDNTDAGFYAAGNDYHVMLAPDETVDSQTVVQHLFTFSIENRSALRPTVAGRTLDVTSGGNAGIDLDNIVLTGNGPFPAFGVVDIGTAQAADATSITLRSGFSTAAANMVGKSVWVYSSTNGLHTTGVITAYNNTSKVAMVAGLGEAPTGTVLYVVFATPPASSSYPIPANLIQMGGDAQSATDLKDFADDGYDPATNKVQGVVLTDTVTTYTGNTPQTGDSFARLGAPAGASHAADVAAVKTQTAAIETDTQDIQTRIPAALNNGVMPADMQRINDVAVTGDGSGTPFGV